MKEVSGQDVGINNSISKEKGDVIDDNEMQNHERKKTEILNACRSKDLSRLKELATSNGGLVSDEVRRIAWPILLGYTEDQSTSTSTSPSAWKTLPEHKDEYQVALDVPRSFIYYPKNLTDQQLERKKAKLHDLIISVLRPNPHLSYFQGYHDICQVFLLVFSSPTPPCTHSLSLLSNLRLRDFMLPLMDASTLQLSLIPSLLSLVSPPLYTHLRESLVPPNFALAATITMYSHLIESYSDSTRVFDVLIAREAVFTIYMFVCIILLQSSLLLDTPIEEPEMMYFILNNKMPKPLDLESLIGDAVSLFERYPPERLGAWRGISRWSVLKTARWQEEMVRQTVGDGVGFFGRHVREMEWQKVRGEALKAGRKWLWVYRREVAVGMAVVVGLVGVWVRMTPSGTGSALRAFWEKHIKNQ